MATICDFCTKPLDTAESCVLRITADRGRGTAVETVRTYELHKKYCFTNALKSMKLVEKIAKSEAKKVTRKKAAGKRVQNLNQSKHA